VAVVVESDVELKLPPFRLATQQQTALICDGDLVLVQLLILLVQSVFRKMLFGCFQAL
jgi:hypothetical protein